mgnify:CR=1 FL=1
MVYTATDLLKSHWDRTLPVEPADIAQAMGIRVVPEIFLDGGASGLIEKNGSTVTIRYDMTEPQVRQRFTIAHELGHYAHGHLEKDGTCFRDTGAQFYSRQKDSRETEANQFAAKLLMPASIVRFLVTEKNLTDITRLANLFAVSEAAMGYRLKNLALK